MHYLPAPPAISPHLLTLSISFYQVKPVVSDLDCFLVGSHGVEHEPLPTEQVIS